MDWNANIRCGVVSQYDGVHENCHQQLLACSCLLAQNRLRVVVADGHIGRTLGKCSGGETEGSQEAQLLDDGRHCERGSFLSRSSWK